MKKRMILALVLALVMALTSSCSLIVKDPEVDRQTVVLEVNGETFTKGHVQLMVEDELAYQEFLYANQYGVSLDVNDPEIITQVQEMVLDSLVQQAVVEQKLVRDGYTNLSQEEMAQAQQVVEDTYQSYVDGVVANELADSELPEEEKRQAAEEWMVSAGGYPTREELLESEILSMADEKLYQELIADVTVTEEEVRAAYEERVSVAQADYEYDPQYFDMDMSDGLTIYYYPAGYRYVKHILIGLAEHDQAKLGEMSEQLTSKQQELSSLQAALEMADESALEELTAQHQQLEAELTALEADYASAEEAAFAAVYPKVEEVQGKIAEGQDFDSLMAEYGTDPGMTVEPAKTNGYVVGLTSDNYVASFREAAMALAQAGDVSEPVRSDFGWHIIRYEGDVPEGPVAYDAVRDALEPEVLAEKQNEAYYSVVDTWVNDAEVKKYLNRLDD